MADKVGVLGEQTAITVGTHTVYQCPAGKGARVKLMARGQAGAGGAGTISYTVNGIVVMTTAVITASHFWYSSTAQLHKSAATAPNGAAVADVVAPAPMDWYLTEGDTITYAIGGESAISCNVQAVGSEIDIT